MKKIKKIIVAVLLAAGCSGVAIAENSFSSLEQSADVASFKTNGSVTNVPTGFNRLVLSECSATNNTGSALLVGCGRRYSNDDWSWFQIVDADTPDATGDTTDAKDAGAGDITLFTTVANGGHLVCSDRKFSGWGTEISQGQTGSPVYAYSYYNGSTEVSLTGYEAILPATYTAGDRVQFWNIPSDWARGTIAAVGGPSDRYCIKALSTTAPSQAVLGTIAWVFGIDKYFPSVATGIDFAPQEPVALEFGEGYGCFFSGSVNKANSCSIQVRASR